MGGGSQLDGLMEMGEFLFDMPVRKGKLQDVGGLTETTSSHSFMMGIGLLLYGLKEKQKKGYRSQSYPLKWLEKIKMAFKNAF